MKDPEFLKRLDELKARLPQQIDAVEVQQMVTYAMNEYESYGINEYERTRAFSIVEDFLRSYRDIRDFALMEVMFEKEPGKIEVNLIWRAKV